MFLWTLLVLVLSGRWSCTADTPSKEVTLEAFKPKGFRISTPAVDGLQRFAFHGNLNKPIDTREPGDYSQDVTEAVDGRFSYINDNLELKPNDVLHYNVFFQINKLGFRKDNQVWQVIELVERTETCNRSETIVTGRAQICSNSVIFQDNFGTGKIEPNNWLVEQYLPVSGDYEFVSYQPKTCRIVNKKFQIRPTVTPNTDINGEIDLRSGCTRSGPDECYYKADSVFIIPPVMSGRVVSKMHFRYGKIEIKAKLPAGDWIYPQMYLEEVNNPGKRLLIGYARGNNRLTGVNNQEIGSTVLYGGPVIDISERSREQYLQQTTNNNAFTDQAHTFTVIWSPESLSVAVDGTVYGSYNKETLAEISFGTTDSVRLVLGIGVGGINDFPNNYQSGNDVKPWKNAGRRQVKNFFDAKSKWLSTWGNNRPVLEVSSVKVTAI